MSARHEAIIDTIRAMEERAVDADNDAIVKHIDHTRRNETPNSAPFPLPSCHEFSCRTCGRRADILVNHHTKGDLYYCIEHASDSEKE